MSLSLEEAVKRGLESAPRLAEARAREAAAAATDAARVALGRPALSVTSGYLRTNHVDLFGVPQPDGRTRIIFPDIPDNVRLRAEMSFPIFTGGRVEALVGAARSEREAAAAETRAVTADVTLEITNAYWALVMVRERRAVLGRALERADAVVSDVQARVDTGLVPPNEVQTAQAQRARQRVQFIQAGADVEVAEAQLARLVGLTPGDPILPATPVDQPTGGVGELGLLPAAALTTRAQQSRPERAALVAREGSIRLAGRASAAASLPQVAALAAIEPARPNPRFVPRTDEWNRSWDLGVNVTWSVWDGGRARAEVAAATAQADAAHARVVEFDAGVAVEVRQRLADLASGRAAIEASSEAVEAAREAARVLQERFSAGVATSTDLLDANLELLEAELERTRLATVLRINEARLVRTVGGPTP
jgi:outer membrane protein TolC